MVEMMMTLVGTMAVVMEMITEEEGSHFERHNSGFLLYSYPSWQYPSKHLQCDLYTINASHHNFVTSRVHHVPLGFLIITTPSSLMIHPTLSLSTSSSQLLSALLSTNALSTII